MAGGSESTSAWRRMAAGAVAGLTLIAFLAVLPAAALAHASEPVTIGDWMRTIFVTPDRKIDRTTPALAAAPLLPLIQITLQTSGDQTPTDRPVIRDRLPDAWIRREPWRPRKRLFDPHT